MQQKHDRGRFSAKRKTDAVLRLLRGEELDALSRELGVTAATLSTWRDEFLAAGELAKRSGDADFDGHSDKFLTQRRGDAQMQGSCPRMTRMDANKAARRNRIGTRKPALISTRLQPGVNEGMEAEPF